MNVAIINHYLFVNILLVMKNHCYIIQPLQTCEIWIPSPMSNFFAESPKLYKRWQGCSFNPIWKEGRTQFYLFANSWTYITTPFFLLYLDKYLRKAQRNFICLQILQPILNPRKERSRTSLQQTPRSVGLSKYDALHDHIYIMIK